MESKEREEAEWWRNKKEEVLIEVILGIKKVKGNKSNNKAGWSMLEKKEKDYLQGVKMKGRALKDSMRLCAGLRLGRGNGS